LVLSTAGTSVAPISPALDHVAAVNITAFAGTTFSGVVATFNSPDSAGLVATIDWGDGHAGAGTITNSGNQAYQISGSNTFAHPAYYSIIVTIHATAGNPTTVQDTATVLPSQGNMTPQAAMPAVYIGISGTEAQTNSDLVAAVVVTTPPVPTPPTAVAAVVVTTPAVPTPPATGQPIVVHIQVQVTGPVRVGASDQVPWTNTREQGLGHPSVVQQSAGHMPGSTFAIYVTATAADDAALLVNAEVSGQVTQIIMPNWTGPALLPFVAVFVSGEVPDGRVPPMALTAALDDPAPSAQPQPAGQDIYQLPLHRVADRSELGGLPGTPPYRMLSVALPEGNASAGPIELDRLEVGASTTPAQVSARESSRKGTWSVTVTSLLEVATAWVVFQVLHSTVFPQMPGTAPALPAKLAASPKPPERPQPVP
jgi:hypothetical protein